MARQLFTNHAFSTLSGNILAADLSLSVQAGDGALFPTLTGGDWFVCTLVNASNQKEIVKVTARTIDTFTIVRAQEGTSARDYTSGDRVALRVTANSLALLAPNTFLQAGTGAGTRTIQEKERDIVSILDFYADGVGTSATMVDPSGAVDSTLGIQAAYNTHCSVWNPPGQFKIIHKPRFQVDGQHSYGAGGAYGTTASVTLYKYAGAVDESEACISFRPAATGRHVSDCGLHNIGLDADNKAGMCVEAYDIKNNPGAGYQGTWRNLLENVHCKYATMLGIQWGGVALITARIALTTMTVTANAGRLAVGQTVIVDGPGTALTSGTVITALGTATGGTGTYIVNNSQTVGSESMLAASGAPNFSNDCMMIGGSIYRCNKGALYDGSTISHYAVTFGSNADCGFHLVNSGTASFNNCIFTGEWTDPSTPVNPQNIDIRCGNIQMLNVQGGWFENSAAGCLILDFTPISASINFSGARVHTFSTDQLMDLQGCAGGVTLDVSVNPLSASRLVKNVNVDYGINSLGSDALQFTTGGTVSDAPAIPACRLGGQGDGQLLANKSTVVVADGAVLNLNLKNANASFAGNLTVVAKRSVAGPTWRTARNYFISWIGTDAPHIERLGTDADGSAGTCSFTLLSDGANIYVTNTSGVDAIIWMCAFGTSPY